MRFIQANTSHSFHRLRYWIFSIRYSIFVLYTPLLLCSRNAPVTLSIDFSSQSQWRYAASLSLQGQVQAGERRQSFQGSLNGILVGTRVGTSTAQLRIRLDSSEIQTTFLDPAAVAALQQHISQARATLSLSEGEIALHDLPAPPVSLGWEWSIYRDLAKALPALPRVPVSAGALWERERSIPLETRHGAAIGHLFQTFRFDSIAHAGGSRLACMSWVFTYKIELMHPDTSGVIDDLPGQGKGRGIARIDMARKLLKKAEMEFEVAETAAGGPVLAGLKETARLELIEERTDQ